MISVQSKEQKMTDNQPAKKAPPLFLPHSSASTELNKTGSWRYVRPFYDEKTSPCSAACPLGEDIARIEHLVSQNLIAEARQTILIENPFPAVCGRVCFHYCESACNRAQLDEPIAIRHLERFLGDMLISNKQMAPLEALPANGKKVAIAGAGPAGLAAAYFLSLLGYRCEVYEATAAPGGILRWGIPTYRLPQDVVEKEIRRIEELGVIIHCRTPVTGEMLHTFKTRYDAAFIGCGYGRAIDLRIDGAQKAVDGLQLLYRIRADEDTSLKGNAAIIGGGNTAVDVARSLVRLGVDPVIVYRRRRQDMPAFDPEVQMALNEGVKLMELLSPIRIEAASSRSANRRPLFSVALQKMKVSDTEISGRSRVVPDGDKTQTLRVNHVITAIGAEPEAAWHQVPTGKTPCLDLSHCKLVNDGMPIAYGGDLTNRLKSVADAIASGKQAAVALDTYFESGWDAVKKAVAGCQVGAGPAVSMTMYLGEERKNRNPQIVSFNEINTHYFKSAPRVIAPVLPPEDRTQSFLPIESMLSEEAALAESRRCFNCGICNACDYCRLYCPEMSVMVEDERRDINLDYCKGCGLCVAECPRNAMALKEENI
jgi:NADPH-dependent glutamate synthase beta subunit-like oxidoreductase/ferredoxin